MVAVIVAPTLIVLIVQVTTFPLTLHTTSATTINEVVNRYKTMQLAGVSNLL